MKQNKSKLQVRGSLSKLEKDNRGKEFFTFWDKNFCFTYCPKTRGISYSNHEGVQKVIVGDLVKPYHTWNAKIQLDFLQEQREMFRCKTYDIRMVQDVLDLLDSKIQELTKIHKVLNVYEWYKNFIETKQEAKNVQKNFQKNFSKVK